MQGAGVHRHPRAVDKGFAPTSGVAGPGWARSSLILTQPLPAPAGTPLPCHRRRRRPVGCQPRSWQGPHRPVPPGVRGVRFHLSSPPLTLAPKSPSAPRPPPRARFGRHHCLSPSHSARGRRQSHIPSSPQPSRRRVLPVSD